MNFNKGITKKRGENDDASLLQKSLLKRAIKSSILSIYFLCEINLKLH